MPKLKNKGPVTMQAIAEKLDTVSETVLQTKTVVDDLKATQIEQSVHIDRIIGPPSLEDRLRAYVDEQDKHKAASSQQALVQMQTILQQQSEIQQLKVEKQIAEATHQVALLRSQKDEQHKENTQRSKDHEERMRRVERRLNMYAGGLAALELLATAVELFKHFGK